MRPVASRRRQAPRHTRQRAAILRAMEAASCHLTAEELHHRLRRPAPSIGLATVYRALEAFVRDGLVEPAFVGDGKVRYGLAAKHHDHLVCLRCGQWEALDDCLLPRVPPLATGFRVTGHRLDLYGYCRRCEAA